MTAHPEHLTLPKPARTLWPDCHTLLERFFSDRDTIDGGYVGGGGTILAARLGHSDGGHDVPDAQVGRRWTRALASSRAYCPRQGQIERRRCRPVRLWPRNSSVALRSSTNSAARLSCSCSM